MAETAGVDGHGAEPVRAWSGGGREELADAVRRLIALTVTAVAPPEALAAAAREAGRLADELEAHVAAPGTEPVSRMSNDTAEPGRVPTLSEAIPFDVVVGPCNPLAVPIELTLAPPKAHGRAVFTAPYGGAPGLVHGAVLAGAFDLILTGANVVAEAAGPTVSLTLRYLRPTRLDRESLFEGWVTDRNERRTWSSGRLIQDGVVTVEADGEFVNMSRERIVTMHRQEPDGPAAGGPAPAPEVP